MLFREWLRILCQMPYLQSFNKIHYVRCDIIFYVMKSIFLLLSEGPLMTTELQRKGKLGGTTWYMHKDWFTDNDLARIYPERDGRKRMTMIKLTKRGEEIASKLKEIERLLKGELIVK